MSPVAFTESVTGLPAFTVTDCGSWVISGNAESRVNNALADPVLALYDSNANIITANDNWKDSQQRAIANTGLQPPNDLDAAVSVTLAAGNDTAMVTGKDGSTGVALVEVYATQ